MRTYKQAENVGNVEEGDGGNKEKYEEDFSWLAEEVQEEQQHLPTCTWISKPAVQVPATGPSWNSYLPFLQDKIKRDPRKIRIKAHQKTKVEMLFRYFLLTANKLSLLS